MRDRIANKKHMRVSPYLGWLAPDGTFVTVGWGQHEDMAWLITEHRGWKEEFQEEGYSAGDYLVRKKGYILLDDPSASGVIHITRHERMTKQQEDFLWDVMSKVDDRRACNELLHVLNNWF